MYRKIYENNGHITEMVIWKLSQCNHERPHGLKYRLYHGDQHGNCIVRYDNEHGKGDHKHIGTNEFNYEFSSVEQLIQDFLSDINLLNNGGNDNDSD